MDNATQQSHMGGPLHRRFFDSGQIALRGMFHKQANHGKYMLASGSTDGT